jgi:F-type H+-transporting ATPase subunit epsilon
MELLVFETAKDLDRFTSGKLFIDPENILLTDSGDAAPGSGTVKPGDPPSVGSPDTLTLDVNSFNALISQNALSRIDLQATRNIEIGTLWKIPNSQDPNGSLTLTAGNTITLDDGSGIAAGRNWNINMSAGPQNLTTKPSSGTDGIYLLGNSYIEAQNGNINLWAANEVLLNTGDTGDPNGNGIRTLAGGNIHVTTQYGDINAGANAQNISIMLTMRETVDEVIAPGSDGYFGVLPGHTPLLAVLQVGELWYRQGQEKHYVSIAFGFAEVQPDRVTILAQIAEKADEIDLPRAEAAKKRAEARLATSTVDMDAERARISLLKSLIRLQVATRARIRS